MKNYFKETITNIIRKVYFWLSKNIYMKSAYLNSLKVSFISSWTLKFENASKSIESLKLGTHTDHEIYFEYLGSRYVIEVEIIYQNDGEESGINGKLSRLKSDLGVDGKLNKTPLPLFNFGVTEKGISFEKKTYLSTPHDKYDKVVGNTFSDFIEFIQKYNVEEYVTVS